MANCLAHRYHAADVLAVSALFSVWLGRRVVILAALTVYLYRADSLPACTRYE